jgi:hypothetical protein
MEIKFKADETDLSVLNAARNRVAYGGYVNSLVEWTLSPGWTEESAKFRGPSVVSGELTTKENTHGARVQAHLEYKKSPPWTDGDGRFRP